MTSTAFTGDLGGLAGGDAKCQTAADAAGLEGSWVAFLSSWTVAAPERVDDVGPWFDLTGRLVFNNVANLRTTPQVKLDVDEWGNDRNGFEPSWTGTMAGGESGWTCADWTYGWYDDGGTIGIPVTDAGWSDFKNVNCDEPASLYCPEQ